jgi:hypothetical protein
MSARFFIFGTGSHARKIYHYAKGLGWTVTGFIDEAIGILPPIAGFNVIAPSDLNAPQNGDSIFVAVGNPNVRARLMTDFQMHGWLLPPIVHRTAWVAPDAVLEDGVLIAAGAIVETLAVVERGAIVDIGGLVDHDARVLAYSHLRPGQICSPSEVWPSK